MKIQAKNLATALNSYTAITNLCEVFGEKPQSEPSDTYLYVQLVTDNVIQQSNRGPTMRQSQFNVYVVCKESLGVGEYAEGVIASVFDAIDDNVVSDNCQRVNDIDGIRSMGLYEGSTSSIGYISDRPVMVKSYFIKYRK